MEGIVNLPPSIGLSTLCTLLLFKSCVQHKQIARGHCRPRPTGRKSLQCPFIGNALTAHAKYVIAWVYLMNICLKSMPTNQESQTPHTASNILPETSASPPSPPRHSCHNNRHMAIIVREHVSHDRCWLHVPHSPHWQPQSLPQPQGPSLHSSSARVAQQFPHKPCCPPQQRCSALPACLYTQQAQNSQMRLLMQLRQP